MSNNNLKLSVDKNIKNLNSNNIFANKIDVDTLNADNLNVDNLNVAETITAANAIITDLEVENINATTIDATIINTTNAVISNSLSVNTIKTNSINSNAITINTSYISTLPHPVCFSYLNNDLLNTTGNGLVYKFGQNANLVNLYKRGININSSGLVTILSDGIYEIDVNIFCSNVNNSYSISVLIVASDNQSLDFFDVVNKPAFNVYKYKTLNYRGILNLAANTTLFAYTSWTGQPSDDIAILGISNNIYKSWISVKKI